MTPAIRQRWMMAGFGLLAGASLYALSELLGAGVLGERAALFVATFAAVFFLGLLGMIGPLRPAQALAGAAGVALLTASLMGLASFRHDRVEDWLSAGLPVLAGTVLAWVPLPFVIAGFGPGWRDYPALFSQAWGLVVRYAAAWLFVALVWAILFLSDTLLSLVGIRIINDLVESEAARWLITGGALGLGLAVVQDFDAVVSPWLILRLLRLLLPVVLVVMAVFVLALPVRVASHGVLERLSASATLLAMMAAAVTLVTAAVDRTDEEATASALLRRAAQAMAVILPVPAVMAVWGIWLRVAQYGWTPGRLFLAAVGGLGLGYALLYALAVARGAGWMARVRRANVAMAVAVLALAALWLTPALDAEAISARSQVGRYVSGRVAADGLDMAAIDGWGRAGQAARSRLQDLAEQPGHDGLAAALAGNPLPVARQTEDLREDLAAILPVQPQGAEATRDMILRAVYDYDLQRMTGDCTRRLPSGAPGCVMVIADFWPAVPGEEALFVGLRADGTAGFDGFALVDGLLSRPDVARADGGVLPAAEDARALIRALQEAPPPLSAAPLNQVRLPQGGVILRP
ncbi:MAG: DUF4153 domain-containing protein [Paracoccaceae bacterium]